ncbi:hypothetical protein ABT282_30930 [Streptomyces sp. NPDC000927]|uniref:hypothetical protein n=1 Tax=Streptomyces sp. NPDC000927 TaxID=3154371 RepID=UPI00332F1C6D
MSDQAKAREEAARIFGVGTIEEGGRIRWPYGMEDPLPWNRWTRHHKDGTREQHEAEWARQTASQAVLMDWVGKYDLGYIRRACCPKIITRKTTRGCHLTGARTCLRQDADCLDHVTGWRIGRQPVAIATDAYRTIKAMEADAEKVISMLGDDRISFTVGNSWYPGGLPQVVFYRSDIIEMEPARPVSEVPEPWRS